MSGKQAFKSKSIFFTESAEYISASWLKKNQTNNFNDCEKKIYELCCVYIIFVKQLNLYTKYIIQ